MDEGTEQTPLPGQPFPRGADPPFLFYTFSRKARVFSKGNSRSGKDLIQIPHLKLWINLKTLKHLNIFFSWSAPNLSAEVWNQHPQQVFFWCHLASLLMVSAFSPSFYDTYGSVGDTGTCQGTCQKGEKRFCFIPAESGWEYQLLEGTSAVFLPGKRHHCKYHKGWYKSVMSHVWLAQVLQLYLQKWSHFKLKVSFGVEKKNETLWFF